MRSIGVVKPIRIFYSYAHEDESYAETLQKHLALLKHQGLIGDWYDRRIVAGQEWELKINENLMSADIVLLLVSADFIASDYCWSYEMEWAMKRQAADEVDVIPIALHPADWKGAPFAKLQGLPRTLKPISEWPNPAAAFADVAQGLRKVIEERCKNSDVLKESDGTDVFVVEAAYCPHCKSTSIYSHETVMIDKANRYYEGWRVQGRIVNCGGCGMSLTTTTRMINAKICKDLECVECGSHDHLKLRLERIEKITGNDWKIDVVIYCLNLTCRIKKTFHWFGDVLSASTISSSINGIMVEEDL